MGKLAEWRNNYNEVHQFDALANTRWKLYGKTLTLDGREYPIDGAHASYESGAAARQRITATRVVSGLAAAGPLGAIIGGLAKKDETKMYIVVELGDGQIITVEAKARDEMKVRAFVDAVNAASAHWGHTAG